LALATTFFGLNLVAVRLSACHVFHVQLSRGQLANSGRGFYLVQFLGLLHSGCIAVSGRRWLWRNRLTPTPTIISTAKVHETSSAKDRNHAPFSTVSLPRAVRPCFIWNNRRCAPLASTPRGLLSRSLLGCAP
jgi:hypothetical protein